MKFEQIVCVIAIIWYILTAWFSSGYIHLDEQYQIIEFAGYWNGWNQANELTWEFDSQIRSSIQPFLGASIFRFCEWINVTNPFHQAFVLRLLTVVFSLFSIQFFIKSCRFLVSQKLWKTFVLLSYFIWFLPYINVRFSSETWSGLFLLLAIGLLIRNSNSYAPWGYQTNFYKEENMIIQKIVADSTYSKVSKLKDTTDVFALSVNDSHQELVKEIIENLDLKLQSKNVSDWTAPFFRMYGAHDSNVILLYSN